MAPLSTTNTALSSKFQVKQTKLREAGRKQLLTTALDPNAPQIETGVLRTASTRARFPCLMPI